MTEALKNLFFNQAYIVDVTLKNQIDFRPLGVFMKTVNACVGTLRRATDFIDGAIQGFEFTGAYEVNVAVFLFDIVGHAFHDTTTLTLLESNRKSSLFGLIF